MLTRSGRVTPVSCGLACGRAQLLPRLAVDLGVPPDDEPFDEEPLDDPDAGGFVWPKVRLGIPMPPCEPADDMELPPNGDPPGCELPPLIDELPPMADEPPPDVPANSVPGAPLDPPG